MLVHRFQARIVPGREELIVVLPSARDLVARSTPRLRACHRRMSFFDIEPARVTIIPIVIPFNGIGHPPSGGTALGGTERYDPTGGLRERSSPLSAAACTAATHASPSDLRIISRVVATVVAVVGCYSTPTTSGSASISGCIVVSSASPSTRSAREL